MKQCKKVKRGFCRSRPKLHSSYAPRLVTVEDYRAVFIAMHPLISIIVVIRRALVHLIGQQRLLMDLLVFFHAHFEILKLKVVDASTGLITSLRLTASQGG